MTTAPPQSPHPPELPNRRVRTPTLIQMEAVECGAACLGIILGSFGRFVPLEELRVACGVSRDGSKASNLLKAGRAYGLETKAYRYEPQALFNLPLPMIVFWNYAHFVVVEGFGKGKVFINDPASGPRTLSWEEFDEGYSGIALTFQKGEGFKAGGKRSQLMEALRSRLKGSGSALTYAFLAGLALSVPGAAIPIFTKIFVDSYLVHGMESLLNAVLWGVALFAVLRVALTYLQQRALLRLETRLALQMSGQYFWHALSLPLVFYSQRYAGEIGSRVAINDRIAGLLSGQLASTLLSLFTALFYIVLMFLYDVPLTLVGLTFAGLSLFALHYVSRRRADLSHRMMKERGRLVATTMHGLQMMETLKATGGENDFFMRWSGQQAKLTNAEQELTSSTLMLSAIPSLLNALNIAILLGFGGFRVMGGAMTVGELIALQGLQMGLATPIQDLVNLGAILQEIGADLQRLDDVLQCEPDPAAKERERDPLEASTRLTGKLEICDLTFGYSRLDPPLIENFNLTIQSGRRVALVGGSGSGKSTIARLIMGLYTPWGGETLFDGKPASSYSRRLLLHSVAMVDQDIFIFEGTARDNITLWDEGISDEAILQATRDAAIHSDLAIRPGSYECHVAEGGANFSGGQRQRLEIARALALQPSLLILDEATSALDPSTEKIIDENLRRRGCSCLIVAHRLSAIRDCDEIIVLEKGKIVQRGTHTEMTKVDGPYARLLETRADTSRKSYLDFA